VGRAIGSDRRLVSLDYRAHLQRYVDRFFGTGSNPRSPTAGSFRSSLLHKRSAINLRLRRLFFQDGHRAAAAVACPQANDRNSVSPLPFRRSDEQWS